jgi:hypothetical protein
VAIATANEKTAAALAAAIDRRLARCARLAVADQPPGAVVHGVRKDLKRVRAQLRLASDAGAKARAHEEACAGIARKLSRRRDADAVLEALDRLALRADRRADRAKIVEAREHLQSDLAAGADDTRFDPRELRKELLSLRRRVAALDLSTLEAERIADALAHTHRMARRRAARLRREFRAKRFHSLRKSVKRELHQREWLTRRVPGSGVGRKRLKELATLLGENQDIAVLKSFLRREDLHRGRLKRLVNAERDRVRAEALRIAGSLYAD